MRHVILFEPDPSGHRMVFVRYIVEAMARHGGMRATLVTSRRALATSWVEKMRDDLHRHLSFCVIDEPLQRSGLLRLPPKLARQFGYTHLLQSAVRELRQQGAADHVFIPFVDDYCLFPFALQARPFEMMPWGGIAIRPRFHLGRMGASVPPRREDRIEAWAYSRLLRNRSLDALFSIDPYLSPFFADPRIATICDPADIAGRAPDRSWLPVAEDAVVLLVYGYIDHRKAIDRLLRVAADSRIPQSVVVALVGTQDAGMEQVMQSPIAETLRSRGRLVQVARRVSDLEEVAAFARADIIWGYYPGSYCSSGAMVRAGQMGRPLMSTREGLVGFLTQQYGSGLTAPEDNDEALLQQLSRMSLDSELRTALGEAGLRHFAGATGEAFGDRIVRHLSTMLDGPAGTPI